MSEPFVGEIRMFAGNYAPQGWAFCDGQLLAVSQNEVLFSLFGTIYGGDGRTTFALPDMRGRIALHQGTGPGLSPRKIGSRGGGEQVTLTGSQIASHSHDWNANTADATGTAPQGKVTATPQGFRIFEPADQNTDLDASTIVSTGGGQAHGNLMPTLCVNFIVALLGIYPSRN